jgi:hypothetical protein
MRTSRRASDALTSARISSKTLRRRSTIESAALFKDVVQAQAALDNAGWSQADLDKGSLEVHASTYHVVACCDSQCLCHWSRTAVLRLVQL